MALPKRSRETGSRAVGSREFAPFSPIVGEAIPIPAVEFTHPFHEFLSSTYVDYGTIDIIRWIQSAFPQADGVLRSSQSWEDIATTYSVVRVRPNESMAFIVIDSKNGITCAHVIPSIIIDSIAVPIARPAIAKHVPEAAPAWSRLFTIATQEPETSSHDDTKILEFFEEWRIPADYLPESIGELRRVFTGLSAGTIPLDSGRKRQSVRSVAGAVKLAIAFSDIFTGETCTRF